MSDKISVRVRLEVFQDAGEEYYKKLVHITCYTLGHVCHLVKKIKNVLDVVKKKKSVRESKFGNFPFTAYGVITLTIW